MRWFVFLFILFPALAWGICVSDRRANLRQGPSVKDFEVKWEAVKYTPLRALGSRAGWYRVENVDGKIMWIRADLVTDTHTCATIKSEWVHLRTGPGLSYPLAAVPKGNKYLSFKVLSRDGEWYRLQDIEGDIVWVHRRYIWIQ